MDYQKQVILVTGATDGIGELTAQKLANLGATVLIHGRDEQKVQRKAQKIRTQTGNEHIEEYTADFSALSEVRRLSEEILAKHSTLDVLINNAGIGYSTVRETSKDGFELRFAVNYLAPFLLTNLLLPVIQNPHSDFLSRIVNLSSAGQEPIDFEDVMLEERYNAQRAYNQSKLALILFTFEMAERSGDKNFVINCLHPGTLLNTKMVTGAGISPMGEPDTGADAVVHLATSARLKRTTGKYFNRKKEARAHPQAYDAEARKKLWELSEQISSR